MIFQVNVPWLLGFNNDLDNCKFANIKVRLIIWDLNLWISISIQWYTYTTRCLNDHSSNITADTLQDDIFIITGRWKSKSIPSLYTS